MTPPPISYRGAHPPERHRAMMATPDRWPMWPFLPLKRYAIARPHQMDVGYLIDDGNFRHRVWLNVVAFANPSEDVYIHYDSFEAVLADGWEVD